ncbi:MAG: carbohydrate ABC transporter permease [Actinomycetota bacterium]
MARTTLIAGDWDRRLRRLAWPLLGAAAVLVVLPMLMTLALAFTDYDALHAPRFSALDNIRRLWRDDIFHTTLWNSVMFAAIAVPLRLGASLGCALLFARRRRGTGIGRALVYLPTVVPDVSYALLWLWVFNPLYGPLNLLLGAMGLPGPSWLLSAWGARTAIVIMSLFQIGEGFVVALAVRHDIPQELYELAAIDGVRPSWTFRRVTLPLMAPALMLLAARDIVFTFQQTFVPSLVVTEGGPLYATTFLSLYTYDNAFQFLRFGYASAMTLVMYMVTALMVGAQFLVLRRWRARWEW